MTTNDEQNSFRHENDPVSKLLGGLKRVEAPGDFDFSVKARIAKGRPAARSASWFPAVARLAVPLGVLLSVSGYFGYNSLYSTNNVAVVPVIATQSVGLASVSDVSSVKSASVPAIQKADERVENNRVTSENKTAPRQNEKRIVLTAPANKQPGGGSYDTASRAPLVILPKRQDANRKIPAKDILTFIGIDADAAWKVGSVKQNSVAERSGLKAGDVIEAVNDQTLTEKTTFGNKSNGKSLRVRRDGKSVQIDLKP